MAGDGQLSAISRPASLTEATSRLRKNLPYFCVNYTAIVALSLALSLVTHPVSLFLLISLLAAWSFLYLFRPSDPPLTLFGRTFSDKETLGGLILVSVIVIFMTSVGSREREEERVSTRAASGTDSGSWNFLLNIIHPLISDRTVQKITELSASKKGVQRIWFGLNTALTHFIFESLIYISPYISRPILKSRALYGRIHPSSILKAQKLVHFAEAILQR